MFTHDRLKATGFKPAKHVPLWYEPKFNGWRITFFKQENGELLCFGRTISDELEMMDSLAAQDGRQWLWNIRDNLPPLSSLDGELYVPGVHATSVKTHINAKSPCLHFVGFAIPWWRGAPQFDAKIETVSGMIKALGVTAAPRFKYKGQSAEDLLKHARSIGIEGYMMKASHYLPKTWWKLKCEETIDVVVMAYNDGKGKYIGDVGSIVAGLYKGGELVPVGNVSGFDDEMRSTLGSDDIGRVIEVRFQAVAAKGGLQHARFQRWREDKRPEECLYEQLSTADKCSR